jgi:hypothetical protein
MTIVVVAAVTDAATDAQAIARVAETIVTEVDVLPGVIARLLGRMPYLRQMERPVAMRKHLVRPARQNLRVSRGLPKRHAHLARPGLLVPHRDRKAQENFAWC